MDDILILASTRWKLRKAIKVLNQTFDELGLEKHPDKTAVGKIEIGFDFLGYRFSPQGFSVAKKTLVNFVVHLNRLYERERLKRDGFRRLGEYVRRWWSWVVGGLGSYGNWTNRSATADVNSDQ